MDKLKTKRPIRHLRTKRLDHCRSCGSQNLNEIISFGNTFVSNFVDDRKRRTLIKAPLTLVICDGCHLVQLGHQGISGELLYRHYWYRSGMNQTMRTALGDIVSQIMSRVKLGKGDIAIDIGANDGTLLSCYPSYIKRIGFEPARNLKSYSEKNVDLLFNTFFAARPFLKSLGGREAKVITSIAMFYDLENPNEFVQDIVRCLDDNGLWIIQMSYLPLMLEQNAFDNICHEHLEYYSLSSLSNLLEKHGLFVQDIEFNDINGGSFRIYVYKASNNNPNPTRAVTETLEKEKRSKLSKPKPYLDFAKRVNNIKKLVMELVTSKHQAGQSLYVYGASTKGNTLLQFFGLDNSLIEAAAERNPDKWGLRTVGTNIPIISEEQARAAKPDYFLILPWHFLDEFREREKEYLLSGGKFIVPLPNPQIIGG